MPIQNFQINNLAPTRPKRDAFNKFNLVIESKQVYPNNDLVVSFSEILKKYTSPTDAFSVRYAWENILKNVAQEMLNKFKNIDRIVITVDYLQLPEQNIPINYDVSITVEQKRSKCYNDYNSHFLL